MNGKGGIYMEESRPNIVMIMVDQMAHDVVGALGHPVVKTPNIDRLVQNGISFSNSYCNSPICAPSRASFVTGMMPSKVGAYDNGSELPAGVPTFVHHLRRAGYETVLSGKMHYVGPDQLHGFEHRLTRDIHATGFELTPDWTRGEYANPGTGVKRLKNAGVIDWNNHLAYDEKVLFRTLEKIRDFGKQAEQKPFFLCASLFHPHDPFVITETYWNMYSDVDIPLPDIPSKLDNELHPFNQWIQTHHEVDTCTLTDDEIRNNRQAYYGMVTYIDDKVGQIIDELERMNLLEDTMIIFTSDHGEMLGEHGMWFKRTFYDPSTKVPLIISYPDRYQNGKVVDDVVSLIDLSATILKIAEVPDGDKWIAEMDGNSFHALLDGHKKEWKSEAIIEYCGEGALRPMITLRAGRYKYVHVHGYEPLMYDLEKDPHETQNIVSNSDYESIAAELKSRIMNLYDLDELEKQVLKSQKDRLMIVESLQKGHTVKWQMPNSGLSRDW
jgi:choline-sulfatase